MKKILILSSFIMVAFLFTSCKNQATDTKEVVKETTTTIQKATDIDGKEYTAAYICPMYCVGSGSDKPGNCPACKMDYVANPKQKTDNHEGHNHDHGDDHSGHNH